MVGFGRGWKCRHCFVGGCTNTVVTCLCAVLVVHLQRYLVVGC